MNKIKNIASTAFCMAMLAFSLLITVSCDDSSDNTGMPEISGVRKTAPEKADSLFTQSQQGEMILIFGKNLNDILHVYINDQEVYFNPTLNTDHSVIVTIPMESETFKLTTWDSSLKDEIRIETTHGTATYKFKVLNPVPYLQRIAGLYPRSTGDRLQLYGMNVLDVERVYFTDIEPEQLDELKLAAEKALEEFVVPGNIVDVDLSTLEFNQNHYYNKKTQAYETSSVMNFTMPSLNYQNGSMVVECAAGMTYVEFAAVPPRPVMTSLSSDMPMKGEVVTITGRNFIQVESVKYDNVVIPASDLYVSESEDSIVFTMGDKPEADWSKLTVTTPGGEVAVDFYDYSSVIVDFDGKGIDNGWGPNASFGTTDGSAAPFTGDGVYGHFDATDFGWNWWGQMIYFRASDNDTPFTLPSYEHIPANTSADDIYLAMEVYNNGCTFNNDFHVHYLLQGNMGDTEFVNWDWGTSSYIQPVLSDINGEQPQRGWYRSLIPMSKFGTFQGKTYEDIVNAGIKQVRLMDHNYTGNQIKLDIYFDNIRIIKVK